MFRSFQSRLLVLFLGLFAAVLSATLLMVHAANTANARIQIDDSLEVASGVFTELVHNRAERLIEAARLLSGDFAFKTAYATADHGTVLSALENHRERIGADLILLASLDYEVLVDTRAEGGLAEGSLLPLADRLEAAVEKGRMELSTIVVLEGAPYQLVVVPLLVPIADAWLCIGFRIDDEFADHFRRLTLAHVTLLSREADAGWTDLASTLSDERRTDLRTRIETAGPHDRSVEMTLDGEPFVTLLTTLQGAADGAVIAVLQRSLDEALRPHLQLRKALIALFFSAIGLCVLIGLRLAASISRPVREMAAAAGRVQEGDYSGRVEVRRKDEVGELGEAFNEMVRGLEDRSRVRSLLGKVVSPAIARELMSKEIELGGELRPVSVLFADVRDFASHCENTPPGEILGRLNRYLTAMTRVIEAEDGVVDKYVGDAIMALFGAPISHEDDAARAVRTALAMQRALVALNGEFRTEGAPEFAIGIGINTAEVVAGNMGSTTRLNYTVLGDGVNVASRLEQLTKAYGVGVLVSEATCRAASDLVYREIDRVRVKGRQQPVTIHEPLGPAEEISATLRGAIEAHHRALAAYRAQRWGEAFEQFKALASATGERLPALFLQRIEVLRRTPPPPDWDGTL